MWTFKKHNVQLSKTPVFWGSQQQPHLRLCNFQHGHWQAQNLQLQVDRHGVWLWPSVSTDCVSWKSWHSNDSWLRMWRNCICQIGCGKVNSNVFLDALVLEPWWCMKCRIRQPLRWLFYYLQGFIHPMLEYRMLDHGKCRGASWKNGLIRFVSFVSCCEAQQLSLFYTIAARHLNAFQHGSQPIATCTTSVHVSVDGVDSQQPRGIKWPTRSTWKND